jgi:purine-binding chemotaxis protein CheW
VLEYSGITRVPKTPAFLAGIINLRGSVVPVIDLRIKLGLPPGELNIDSSILIIEIDFMEELTLIGVLVDCVKSVVRFDPDKIEDAPRIGMTVDLSFISAIGRIENDFVMILNENTLFSEKELSFVRQDRQEEKSIRHLSSDERISI